MFKTLKQHFRILPMVIFMATLMLSVRINNLFDMLKNPAADRFSISQSLAAAEEKNNKETADLNKLLEASDSAIKINGQKLYELARKGKEVARTPRRITILELELLGGDRKSVV